MDIFPKSKDLVKRMVRIKILFFIGLLLLSTFVLAETEPLYIESNALEVDQKQNIAIFKGNVKAKQKDMELQADIMKVFYTTEKGKKTNQATIKRIEAEGNVVITQGERKAFGEKAIFYRTEEKIVLEGNAKLTEGDNWIEGDEMVFLLKENKTIIKGLKQPVEAILYPEKKDESYFEGR